MTVPVRSLLAVVVLLAATAVYAQAPPDPLEAADAMMRVSEYEQARELFDRALAVARRDGEEARVARALVGLAEISQRLGNPAGGRAAALEAMAIADRLDNDKLRADAHLRIAVIEQGARNREAAMSRAQLALSLYEKVQDDRGIAAATVRLGDLHEGDLDEQRILYHRAARHAGQGGDRRLEGVALHALADRLFFVSQYQEALELLTRAAAAFESANARVALGTVYNSIGRVYRAHGRLDEALEAQQRALAIHRGGGDEFALLQSLNAVSAVQQRLFQDEAARATLQEAIDLAAAMPSTPNLLRAQDFLQANMASLLIDVGDYAPAASTLEQVVANGRDAFPSFRQAQLSYAYAGMGRTGDAVAAAERAVTLCGTDKITCIGAYTARANALAAAGNKDDALRDLSQTLQRLEEVRAQLVPSDFFKQGFAAAYGRYYSTAIAAQFEAGLARESLESAELARSRAFLDLLASRSIAPMIGEGELPSPVAVGAATSAELTRAAERLQSTMVLFWVSDAEVFSWVVTPAGQVHARRTAITRARLAALVRETTPFASSAGAPARSPSVLKDASAAWRRLHTLLIEPIRPLLPTQPGALLTIVPHDVLANVSFAALPDGRGRYLIEDYTLHYAAAGALFPFTRSNQQRRGDAQTTMLMVADPVTAARSALDRPLPRLPGAAAEARAIAGQVKPGGVVSLAGAAATEAAVRSQVQSRSIVHFASHSVVSEADPFASYLALGRSGDGEENDGVLTAREVYGLDLAADLVVLSACRSAGGAVGGDGVAAFARAFIYAGAASLIASAWEVADEPSNRLLPAFYRSWRGGATKAAALRRAQLQLLEDLRRGRVRVTTPIGPVVVPSHPVFWAGFMLFGEPE